MRVHFSQHAYKVSLSSGLLSLQLMQVLIIVNVSKGSVAQSPHSLFDCSFGSVRVTVSVSLSMHSTLIENARLHPIPLLATLQQS